MAELEKTGGTMNCGVVTELLESYHAGKLNARAEQSVQEHLEGCAACSVRLASLERKSKANEAGVPVGVDEVLATADAAPQHRWQGVPKLALLAIGLAIVVVPGSFWFASTRARSNDAPAVAEGVPAVAALRRMGDDETESVDFTLRRPTDLRVYALGEGMDGEMYDYGWIVDAKTGRRVWSMEYSETRPAGGADKNRLVDDIISLDPGSYVLQYTTDDSHSYDDWNSDPPRDRDAWGITLTVAEGRHPAPPRPPRPERARGELAEAIATATAEAMEAARVATAEAARATRTEIAREIRRVRADAAVVARLTRVGDDEDLREPFTLDDDSAIMIYALGEATGGEMYDYAWIEDAGTGRTVWRMTYEETSHAGGAEKNRVAEEIIRLEKGEYVLRYRSDDSHSFEGWNSAEPRDASHYGVTVFRMDGR
jgi:hypothetical protein